MILHAAMRPKGDTAAEQHAWSVEADTYEAAFAEVQLAVPEGWVLLHVQRG